jgi:NADPH:quinone reductase-like Zn-dependent oxidoreductase
LEVSGEIIQIHSEQECEHNFELGEKVFGLVAGGGYAEYVAVNTEHLMSVPKNLTMQQAAGIAECFLTAYQVMFIENALQPKQHVLIHAGASGVGLAAIQLAKHHGCVVAVTASNQTKLNHCHQFGADLLINYKQQNFADEISKQWSGCDLIIDFVAGDYLNRNLKLLNVDGSLTYLAMLAGRFADQLDMALMLGKRATIKGSTLRSRSDQYKSDLIKSFNHAYLAEFTNQNLGANIDTLYAAEDVNKAHQRIESNDSMGKLICSW